MKKSLVVGTLFVAWAVGCGSESPSAPEGERTQSTTSAIQGGSNDTTHTFAVGVLVNINAQQGEVAFCSGALLAPNLVATARHCAANISSTQIDCATATFGADFATTNILVTTDATITQNSAFLHVAQVVTPQPTAVCGDDLALLILTSNVQLPEYVTPVLTPPMSDHSLYSSSVTAIGYGINTPTDMNGTSAGTRRIRENIALQCIPNDSTFPSCLSSYQGQMTANEFYSGDGTCEGDSGSSAYDQGNFNNGNWVSFGVLSRGGVSPDMQTCQGGIYTRFDAWASLIQQTALQAASMGGYTAPPWATSDDGGTDAGAEASTGKSDGTSCNADGECASSNCVSIDGKNYVCAAPCGSNMSCPAQFSCRGNAPSQFCFPNNDSAATTKAAGCAVAAVDPQPVPWKGVGAGLALGAAVFAARRRRRG